MPTKFTARTSSLPYGVGHWLQQAHPESPSAQWAGEKLEGGTTKFGMGMSQVFSKLAGDVGLPTGYNLPSKTLSDEPKSLQIAVQIDMSKPEFKKMDKDTLEKIAKDAAWQDERTQKLVDAGLISPRIAAPRILHTYEAGEKNALQTYVVQFDKLPTADSAGEEEDEKDI